LLVFFGFTGGGGGGSGLPPACHTQHNQANPTAGGPRPFGKASSATGYMAYDTPNTPIPGGAQSPDQKSMGVEPTHVCWVWACSRVQGALRGPAEHWLEDHGWPAVSDPHQGVEEPEEGGGVNMTCAGFGSKAQCWVWGWGTVQGTMRARLNIGWGASCQRVTRG
jgi:hypothetical protein